jgi:hypothetical protein
MALARHGAGSSGSGVTWRLNEISASISYLA